MLRYHEDRDRGTWGVRANLKHLTGSSMSGRFMRAIQYFLISAFMLFAAAGQVQAALITLTYDDIDAWIVHQSHPVIDGIDRTISGSANGNSSAVTTNYSQPSLDTVILKLTTNQSHAGTDWTYLYATSYTRFTANVDSLTYAIDGQYLAQALAGDAPQVSHVPFCPTSQPE